MMRKIPIVFACNNNYAPYAGVAITSIVENASRDFFYDIYVFFTELDADLKARFSKMVGKNYSVTLMDINEYIDKSINFYENFHFSKEMYYRIVIPQALKQYNKVIYLDCDIVVLGDISELYKIDIDNYIIAAVSDVQHYESKEYVINKLKLDPEKYINSGVLVINCKKFIQENIFDKCIDILKNSDISFRYPDQDMINLACADKIKYLDFKWNYIWHYNFSRFNRPKLELDKEDKKFYSEGKNDIKIIHYTSNIKPWNNYNTIFTSYEFDYARKTPAFKDIFFSRFNSIPLKNYIVLQFIDFTDREVVLTGAFYSIEDYLYRNKIYYKINNEQKKLPFYFCRNIDIFNLCYKQRFFKLKLPRKNLTAINISFYRQGFNKELLIKFGKYFPISPKLSNEIFFDNNVLFVKNDVITIQPSSRIYFRQYNKRINKNILANEKKAKQKILVRKLYRLTKPFIKKDIWLISDRVTKAGDNGEAFFKYISSIKHKNIKPYFVIDKNCKDYKRLKKYGKVLSPFSNYYKFIFLHSKAIISSNLPWKIIAPFRTDFIKDFLINQKVVFLQHGITKDDISLSYSRFNQNINYFIVASAKERLSIISNLNYGLQETEVLLTGFPRFDSLKNEKKNLIYVLPTWRRQVSDLLKSDINKAKNTEYFKTYYTLLNDKKLNELLTEFNYKLVFVSHPESKKLFSNVRSVSNNVEILTEGCNYNDVFRTGALLITDYSSVAFDFAYLKKPIIYYQFDKTSVFSGAHTYKKGYFEYERDGFGPVVTNKDDLLLKIEESLKNNCLSNQIYNERIDNFFEFFDKNNCERVFKNLCQNLNCGEIDYPKSLIYETFQSFHRNGIIKTFKRIKNYIRSKRK